MKNNYYICHYCGKQLNNIKFITNNQFFCRNCYLSYQNISSTTYNRHELLKRNRVHIEDPLAITNLENIVSQQLKVNYLSAQQLIVVCIGTDRSTGDSLGPLIGSKLSNFHLNNKIKILGTLNSPVHATNLNEKIEFINNNYNQPFVIAIDAGLGKSSSVGSISVKQGPLKPGSGVNKELPEIGDLHITGLVNVTGYMEYFVLQSTRLSLVMKMAKIIAYSLAKGLKKIHN